MAGGVERAGVADRLPAPPRDLLRAGVLARDRRRLHHRGRQQQQVVFRKLRVVGGAEPPSQVLRLAVVVPAVFVQRVFRQDRRDLQRVGEFVGVVAPFHAGLDRGERIEPLVADAEAVHLQQHDASRVAADRRPHRKAQAEMLRHRHLFDNSAERFEPLRRRAHLGLDVGFGVRDGRSPPSARRCGGPSRPGAAPRCICRRAAPGAGGNRARRGRRSPPAAARCRRRWPSSGLRCRS